MDQAIKWSQLRGPLITVGVAVVGLRVGPGV